MTQRQRQDATTRELVRAIRRSRIPLRHLADRAGIDPGIVSRLLAGKRGITLRTADRLARALGLRFRLEPRQPGRRA